MKYIFTALLFLITFPTLAQQFRLLRPVPDSIETNGSYLYAEPNINNSSLGHRGIDIRIKYDTVYSASDGIVEFVGYNPNDTIGGYEPNGGGNYIRIKSLWDGKNLYLYYMHLTKPIVDNNDAVIAGEPIAISGNTGNSTGAHLHFEIRLNTSDFSALRSRRNPELWVGISGTGAIYGHISNAPNNTRVDIDPDPKPRPPYTTFGWALTYNFNDVYIGSDDIYNENYAIGDVKPGTYTITALNGAYQRVVTVNAGEIVNADPPVPVELTSFTASVNNLGQVILNWITATEINNRGFEIERKYVESRYITVGFVEGNGTTTSEHSYSYKDDRTQPGKTFYRLKQIDFNGQFEYSDEIEIYAIEPSFTLEQNYPNPFNPYTTISYNLSENAFVILKVFDNLGSEVALLVNEEKTPGRYKVLFDASDLATGVYVYSINIQSSENSIVYRENKKMIYLK